ncbi:MAG TPA: hypothetical protein VNU26_13515 [Mycobacteriales bacterium]|nr:hypothetical protein [Mycobacteriales bacterium]
MAHDATHDDLAGLRRWRPRSPGDAAGAPAAGCAPDPVQMGALLDDIGALRLSLSVDMDVLASAVDLRAYDVAAEVVDGERADLAAFSDRASARLSADAARDAPPAPVGGGVVRVLRAALPAAPALAAAAALIGVLAGLAPGPRGTAPDPFVGSNAGFAELFGISEATALEAERDAAEALRQEVVRLMALVMHDPPAAAQALESLRSRVEQVQDDDERAALSEALAEVARLLASLDVRLDATVVTDVVADAGAVREGRVPLPAPSAAPARSDGGTERSAGDDPSTGQPSADPSPAASPAPAPSSPSGPEGDSKASVPEVLHGGGANGSTGLVPEPRTTSGLLE